MKTIRVISLLFLICFSSFAVNNIDEELSNTLSRVSLHFKAIRDEVRSYLESGTVPTNINEEASVIIRKTCLEKLEQKRSGAPFDLFIKEQDSEQEQEIKRALENNDQRKLSELAVDLINTQRNQLLDRAISLMGKIMNGETTPCVNQTTTKVVNGITEKTEVVTLAEVKNLENIRNEYQKLSVYLRKITAIKAIDSDNK